MPGLTSVRQAWTDSVASGLTPAGLAQVLKEAVDNDAEAYLILAEEMEERDAHYASVLGVRKRAVSGIVPVIEPASDSAEDKRLADFVREEIEGRDDLPEIVEDRTPHPKPRSTRFCPSPPISAASAIWPGASCR